MEIGSSSLLPKLTNAAEYQALGGLLHECHLFNDRWRVEKPGQSDVQPDAVVAILELERTLILRRRYILNQLEQLVLPF